MYTLGSARERAAGKQRRHEPGGQREKTAERDCAPEAVAVVERVLREFRGVWVATVSNIDWPSKKGLSSDEQRAELAVQLGAWAVGWGGTQSVHIAGGDAVQGEIPRLDALFGVGATFGAPNETF